MSMRFSGVALLCAGAILVSPEPVRADRSQSFTGNTKGSPDYFNRPVGDGTGGLNGKVLPYHAQSFRLLADASCVIYSTQDYDGYLFLYRTFNHKEPLADLIDGDDDAELGSGTSRIPHDLNVASIALEAGNYVLVNSGYTFSDEGAFQNFVSCNGDVQPLHGSSLYGFAGIPFQQQVWLHNRFVVAIDQVSNHPGNGIATPVRFGSSDSAFFWFYNDTNFEVQIKVLDGCAINGHWWVFFAGTTNQAHRVRVADSLWNQIETYTRVLGPPAPAITDITTAFRCP
jgi:hypothetical protein